MTLPSPDREIPRGPDCLCAWYESCEICRRPLDESGPPLTLDDYRRTYTLPADALKPDPRTQALIASMRRGFNRVVANALNLALAEQNPLIDRIIGR